MIEYSQHEASLLPKHEKAKLVKGQIDKVKRDVKRLDYVAYTLLILGLLSHDVIIIGLTWIAAYAISEKSCALDDKRAKLEKQFKHLLN